MIPPDPQPDPEDIQDILNHKPLRWMFKKGGIQHYSKGAWGAIRFEWGVICGAFVSAPLWLIVFLLLFR